MTCPEQQHEDEDQTLESMAELQVMHEASLQPSQAAAPQEAIPLTVSTARVLLEAMEEAGHGNLELWLQHPEADMQWGPIYDIVAPAITAHFQRIALIDPIDRGPKQPEKIEYRNLTLTPPDTERSVVDIIGDPRDSVIVKHATQAETDPLGAWPDNRHVPKDPHLQPEGQPWRFDDAVTNSFTEMIEASIPGYHDMRKLTFKLGRRFLPDSGGVVIDIGSSRGDSLAPFVGAYPDQNYYATEISEPMRKVLHERFPGNNVTICDHDLRYNLSVFEVKSDLILDSLSLMFIPLERRQRLVQAVYDSLKPGGAFISIQKMLGADSYTHDLLDAEYLEMKREHGYTHEQILRKKLSLEGVLVPVTLNWNLDIMKRAGFRRMDVFWKSLQFSGIICVKE